MASTPTRRGLIAAATAGLALPRGAARAAEAPLLALESAMPARHPARGATLGPLARRLAAATGMQVAVVAPGQPVPPGSLRLRHGGLAWGWETPFPGAGLFGGFAFGMTPGELAGWIGTPAARRLWEEGFAAAGLWAVPCGVQASFGATWWPGPIGTEAGLRMRARPGITSAAWELLGVRRVDDAGVAAEDEAARWSAAAPGGGAACRRLPFAFGAVLDVALPVQVHAALPATLRRGIARACAEGLGVGAAGIAVAEGMPLPQAVALALADAAGEVLPRIAGGVPAALAGYADARRRMAWAG
ncbi:hypothetical protein [Falsiroseomonas sp.]|uniref:hypothetical protein n=1 Tax=Falsiroseomonas sp. TaxID=2870721 RepID=UPI0035658F13